LFSCQGVPFQRWQDRQDRLGRFFGPGLMAELSQPDSAHLLLTLLPNASPPATAAP
jgi:hypothetical protein